MIEIQDIATGSDLAGMIGVRQNVISNWRKRYADFPIPFIVLSNGSTPLFSKTAFIQWYRNRLSPELLEALQK